MLYRTLLRLESAYLFQVGVKTVFFSTRPQNEYTNKNFLYMDRLKGESQGHNAIFKGLKTTFRTNILRKKLYHVSQHKKHYKLCFDNFSLRPLFIFDRALERSQAHF